MRVATWNINSVRLRLNQVLELISEKKLDVLCLQETKTQDEFFPSSDFAKIGMKYQYYRGEKSYNGVAILSNRKFSGKSYIDYCKKGEQCKSQWNEHAAEGDNWATVRNAQGRFCFSENHTIVFFCSLGG